jgi:hypothetical protein
MNHYKDPLVPHDFQREQTSPAFCVSSDGSGDGQVVSWRWNEQGTQTVPAIETSSIAVIKFPVAYSQVLDYSPEAMELRCERIKQLGWSDQSFNLPCPPEMIGTYSLLTDALRAARKVLKNACGGGTNVERIYPSMVKLTTGYGSSRADYCVLYFNRAAYEIYHLLFLLGEKDVVIFENIPDPKIDTVPQLLKWARHFEVIKKRAYLGKGCTWNPERNPKKEGGNAAMAARTVTR